jgi:hypothetical protein
MGRDFAANVFGDEKAITGVAREQVNAVHGKEVDKHTGVEHHFVKFMRFHPPSLRAVLSRRRRDFRQ